MPLEGGKCNGSIQKLVELLDLFGALLAAIMLYNTLIYILCLCICVVTCELRYRGDHDYNRVYYYHFSSSDELFITHFINGAATKNILLGITADGCSNTVINNPVFLGFQVKQFVYE